MANTFEPAVLNSYANSEQHVDTSIASNNFTNSARTIVYAVVHGASNSTFKAVGVIQGWSFTEQKQVEELFELGSDVRYIIPGRTTGQVAITRMLINGLDLVNTLYGTTTDAASSKVIKSLKDVNKSLDVMFVTYHNSSEAGANEVHMVRYFDNCWIVARQESITANQVVIAENCTMTYEKVASLSLSTDGGVTTISSDSVTVE